MANIGTQHPVWIGGLVAVTAIYVLIRIVSYQLKLSKMKVPSVGGGLPFIGHAFTMIKGSPWDTMSRWVLEYGMIYKFHLFGSDAVCVSDPALLKIILQTKLAIFKKDLEWTYKPFMVLLGNGLVTADGKSWMKQRTLLSSHLRIDILDEIPDIAFRAVQRFSLKLSAAKADGKAIEMAEEFRHLTLQVIAEALLSLPPEESDQNFAHMYLPIVEEGHLRTWSPQRTYIPSPAWFSYRAAVKRLDDYVSGLIEKRWALRLKESSAGKTDRKQDVLDKCLGAIPTEEWCPAAVRQIRDEVKTFVLAGHETSASMLTWSLYELVSNPEYLERVKEEAKLVYKGHLSETGAVDSIPPRSSLDGLQFTECCLRESLRKYSVVPTVVRIASEDTMLEHHAIPKGTTLMINMQGVHHNPEIWPEPLVYKPQRFLEEIKPYTFLPFIEGPRMCLGQFLSLLESKVVLSTLVTNFTFELQNPEDAGLKHAFMIPVSPKTGHFMAIT